MAIVIRTAYNNNNWKGPCNNPGKDPLCRQCFWGSIQVKPPNKDDIICSGDCWERRICTEYKWGCTPKGRLYGPGAYSGATMYLVFTQPDGKYTIWGKTKVSSTDDKVITTGKNFEDGYAFIHFEPFEPLPRDKWVTGLSDIQLVGARWLQGRHRYIDSNQEKRLAQLIEGQTTSQATISVPSAVKSSTSKSEQITLEITIASSILKKLEEIASTEGRTINELVRQAIAEFIRNR